MAPGCANSRCSVPGVGMKTPPGAMPSRTAARKKDMGVWFELRKVSEGLVDILALGLTCPVKLAVCMRPRQGQYEARRRLRLCPIPVIFGCRVREIAACWVGGQTLEEETTSVQSQMSRLLCPRKLKIQPCGSNHGRCDQKQGIGDGRLQKLFWRCQMVIGRLRQVNWEKFGI